MVDTLNAHTTVWILFAFVALTATKQTFGDPIQCMVPAESTGILEIYDQYL